MTDGRCSIWYKVLDMEDEGFAGGTKVFNIFIIKTIASYNEVCYDFIPFNVAF